jgi:hypothetical protein
MIIARRAVLAGLPFVMAAAPGGAVDVLKFGAKGDGVTDDTQALRAAHAQGRPVFYPKTQAFYAISGAIAVAADVTSDGAMIRSRQDGSDTRTIFRVKANTAPITISGMILDGLYAGQTTGGQWSMCVSLEGAHDVTLVRNVMRAPYGDCVYVGSIAAKAGCSNIRIVSNQLLQPRRCCVAVVCGSGVVIRDNTMTKTAKFVSAIALEPNPNGFDYVTEVKILDNRIDVATPFITASKFNGTETRGLVVRGNRGKAQRLIYVTTAHIRAPQIDHNAVVEAHH